MTTVSVRVPLFVMAIGRSVGRSQAQGDILIGTWMVSVAVMAGSVRRGRETVIMMMSAREP